MSLTPMYDAERDFRNVMDRGMFLDIFNETSHMLKEVLSGHFGAIGNNGVILRSPATEAHVVPKYTMDGREIVDAIEFSSPIKEYIRREIATVGRWVDSKVGDGTTTSMLMACTFAEVLLKAIARGESVKLDAFSGGEEEYFEMEPMATVNGPTVDPNAPYPTVAKSFSRVAEFILEELLKRAEVCSNSKADLIKAQALSSSHGDVELAECVAEAMRHAGSTTECIGFAQRTDMSDIGKRFYTEVDKYQCTVGARTKLFGYYDFNKSRGEAHEESNALAICSKTELINGSIFSDPSRIEMILGSILENFEEEPNAIVFFAAKADAYTSKMLHEVGYAVYGIPVFVFEYADYKVANLIEAHPERVADIYVGLPAHMAGKKELKITTPQSFEDYVFKCSFRYGGHKLSFGDLVDIPEGNPKHPDADNPDTELGNTVQFAREMVDYYTANSDVLGAKDLVDAYNKVIRVAKYPIAPVIYIGGVNTDKMASFEVVQDVIGATKSALESGSVLSPVNHLASLFELEDFNERIPADFTQLDRTFLRIFGETFARLPQSRELVLSEKEYLFQDENGIYAAPTGFNLQKDLYAAMEQGRYIVMQPVESIRTTFEAIKFTALRMAYVKEVIAPGFVLKNVQS